MAMLIFVDETWQNSIDGKTQAGLLSAVAIRSEHFNKYSKDIFSLRVKIQGLEAAQKELKGKGILGPYIFKLANSGIPSRDIMLAEEILGYASKMGMKVFGSITTNKQEINLECADSNQLDRPFFHLFEAINLFLEETDAESTAKLIFDDRGVQTNQQISKTVYNFFHKSRKGQSFDRIVKVPFFGISNENVGIQLADITAYILGRKVSGDPKFKKFIAQVYGMEYKSKAKTKGQDGKLHSTIYGIRTIKDKANEKDAGDI